MSELKLVCEVCNIYNPEEDGPTPKIRIEPYVCFDPATISLPIVGGHFRFIDTAHFEGAPFPTNVDWEHINCPVCRRRPIKHRDRILTPNGYFVVGESPSVEEGEPTPPPEFTCKKCGKTFKTQQALAGHMGRGHLNG